MSEKYLIKLRSLLEKEVNWDEVFNPKDPYESTYLMFLVQAFMGDSSEKEIAELRQELSPEERAMLRANILNNNYIPWAIKCIKTLKAHIDNGAILLYMNTLLNLTFLCIIGSMNSNNKLPRDLNNFFYKINQEEAKTDETKTDYKPPAISTSNTFTMQ